MPRPFSRTVSALALLLAAGTPGPAPAASAQPPGTARAVAAQPARVLLA